MTTTNDYQDSIIESWISYGFESEEEYNQFVDEYEEWMDAENHFQKLQGE